MPQGNVPLRYTLGVLLIGITFVVLLYVNIHEQISNRASAPQWNPVKEVVLSDGTRCTYLQSGYADYAYDIIPGSYQCQGYELRKGHGRSE